MRQRRFIRILLGSGLVLSFGIWGRYIVSTSTTMGTTTELAGISYTLDQYCSVQTGGNQSDPEAIVAFEDTTTNTDGTTVVGVYQIRFCQWLYYEGLSGDRIQR